MKSIEVFDRKDVERIVKDEVEKEIKKYYNEFVKLRNWVIDLDELIKFKEKKK